MDNQLAQLKEILATPALADLANRPRSGVKDKAEVQQSGRAILGSAFSTPAGQLIYALLLLWHDHLDTAHEIAQNIESPDGSFLHALMHRREPDFSNAKYWFRRIGPHPLLAALALRARPELKDASFPWAQRLIKNGQWEPFAFVDACAEVSHSLPGAPDRRALEQLQRLETEVFLEHLAAQITRG